jgi:hypothetical protein
LVDSQEYKDILNKISADSDPFTANANASPLSDIVSTYTKYLNVNQAIIAEAEVNLPKSGYNTANLYTISTETTRQVGSPKGTTTDANADTSGSTVVNVQTTSARTNTNRILVSNSSAAIVGALVTSTHILDTDEVTVVNVIGKTGLLLSSNVTVGNGEVLTLKSISSTTTDSAQLPPGAKVKGYLSGDGFAPNGLDVNMGIAFPGHAKSGDYFLRLDFVPNRLFRYDGKRWIKIEDAVRTNLTPGAANNATLRSSFVNDDTTFTDAQGNTRQERQSLSKILTPKADN